MGMGPTAPDHLCCLKRFSKAVIDHHNMWMQASCQFNGL